MNVRSASHRTESWLHAFVRVALVTLSAAALAFAAVTYLPPAPRAQAAAGDFAIDFMAAAPQSYDHATGGGAWDDATIGVDKDIVSSLEGGDFTCGDTVTYLIEVAVDNTAQATADEPQTIAMDLSFTADSTGQSGMAIGDITNVAVNYSPIQDLIAGENTLEDGMVDDGGSTATLQNEHLNGVMFTKGATLDGTVVLTDLEHGEHVIVRVDTQLMCQPGSHPTGNLQANLDAAFLTATGAGNVVPPAAIGGGNQTIPFKQVGQVLSAGIDIEKYVSVDGGATWDDADTATGPFAESSVTPQFKFVVTNTGAATLTNVTVTDTDFDLTSCGFATTLAAGASDDCIITVAWQKGQNTDTATTTGVANLTPYTDSDDANYYGADPAIDVQKYVSVDGGTTWLDADSPTGPLAASNVAPQFKFVVTNTGNVDLTNVSVTDSDFSLASCNFATTLAAGASDDCIITVAWHSGQNTDTATAAGDFNGTTHHDSDDANYFGTTPPPPPPADLTPQITVTKTASPTSIPETGADVTFTYTVANTGVEDATITSLVDNVFGTLAGDSDCQVGTLLAVGEQCAFSTTHFLSGDPGSTHVDVFTAAAVDNDGDPAVDSDDATVTFTSILPLIQVVKTPSATTVSPGTSVTYTYVVTNKGAEPLLNVTITDDKCSPVVFQSGDLNGDKALDLGEQWTYTCTTTITATTTNTATVSGEDNDGNTATDTDQATVTVTPVIAPTTTVRPAEVLGEELARTGSSSAFLTAIACILVSGGLGLLTVSRLRRRTS